MLKDDILALTKLKRTPKNFGKVQEQLTELRTLADDTEEALTALANARESLSELSGALDDTDSSFLPWAGKLQLAITDFENELPSEDIDNFAELISEAEDSAGNFEEAASDRDYSAQEREDAWGELLDAMENIGNAL